MISHLLLNQLSLAILFLPDLPTALPLLPALIVLALAVGINLFRSVKGTAILKTPLARISLMVLAQIIVLGAFQTKYQRVVDGGLPVVLETSPADPYDFFRGYYQSLRFDITDLDNDYSPFHFSSVHKKGDVVFVMLKKNTNAWVATGVYEQKPSAQDAPFIKGTLLNASKNKLCVHYGIEQFFYPDGKAISIPNGALASVKVDLNGDAVLSDLIAKEKKAQKKERVQPVHREHAMRPEKSRA
jgi:uncharacterized membrane-anchored protein